MSVRFPELATTDVGDMLVIVGTGLLMTRVAGFETVTWAVPAEAISFAGTLALTCVDDVQVVERGEPLKLTVAFGLKN